MSDAKKPKSLFDDFNDTLEGVGNVVSGKIFDPSSWQAKQEAAQVTNPKVSGKADDDAEEIEETRTVRRRRGGTFAPAPKGKGGGSGDGGGSGGDGGSSAGQSGKTDGGSGAA